MGQKQTKTGSSSSSAPTSGGKAPPPSRSDANAFKAWARGQGDALYNAVLLSDKIEQRRAVYTSGKRCGDDEATLEGKITELGSAIVDKFEDLQFGGAENISWSDIDVSKLDAFDAVLAKANEAIDAAVSKASN